MKWIVRFLGSFVFLIALVVGAMVFLPVDRLAGMATEHLAAITGRDVAIKGDISLSFWPVLGVSANDLEVGNADWAEQGPMFHAESAAIGINAMSLLRGEIRITNVQAQSPTIRLVQKSDGRASWRFQDVNGSTRIKSETTPDRATRSLSIARLSVTNATLIYDAEGSDLVSIEGIDVALDWPDPEGAAQISAIAHPGGTPLGIDLSVDVFGDFIAGEISPLTLSVTSDVGQVGLVGRASTSGAAAGKVSISTDDTNGFMRAFGLQGVDWPEKLGRSIQAETELTITPDRLLSLRNLLVDLGGNVLRGAADVSLGGVPHIKAQLDAGALDLSSKATGLKNGNGQKSRQNPVEGWPTAPIDASALGAFDSEIELTAQSIDLGTFDLGPSRVVLRSDNSRMVFELTEVSLYGGNVTGEFVVNNRSGLSVGGGMEISAVQVQPLLDHAIDFDKLSGEADLELTFMGVGQSVDAIMRSLAGRGSLGIGRGTIEGINLDHLLRGGGQNGTTVFDSLTATWSIADGDLTSRDLLLLLKNYKVSGAGVVGLGTRTIDYRFTPVALRANSGNGIAIPVVAKGPWSDVSMAPDFEAVLNLQLDEGRKKLENKAKQRLSEELDGLADDGEAAEDELKDKLKEKLLRKLFD